MFLGVITITIFCELQYMDHSTELVQIAVPHWKTHFKKQFNIQTLHIQISFYDLINPNTLIEITQN